MTGIWQDRAACRGTDADLFFDEAAADLAKAVCALCPVAAPCLEVALREEGGMKAANRIGIFGGLDSRQRSTRYEADRDRWRRPAQPQLALEVHGTEAGARRHRRKGETPCDPCLTAERVAGVSRRARKGAREALDAAS